MSAPRKSYWSASPPPTDRPILVKGLIVPRDGCALPYLGAVEYDETARGWVKPPAEDEPEIGPSALSDEPDAIIIIYCWIDLPDQEMWRVHPGPCGNPPLTASEPAAERQPGAEWDESYNASF